MNYLTLKHKLVTLGKRKDSPCTMRCGAQNDNCFEKCEYILDYYVFTIYNNRMIKKNK
jgi:hypothetical protein